MRVRLASDESTPASLQRVVSAALCFSAGGLASVPEPAAWDQVEFEPDRELCAGASVAPASDIALTRSIP